MIGKTYEFTEDQKKVLKNRVEAMETAETAFKNATAWLKTECEQLWEIIRTIHPELSEWNCAFDREEGVVRIINRNKGK